MKKKCTKCLRKKKIKKFGVKLASIDGLSPNCKKCSTLRSINYKHTKTGLITNMYIKHQHRSKQRGHNIPTYSKIELSEWLHSQPLFHKLYDNWKRLDYQKTYIPSVDRKKDNIGYTMSNIQLMTWGENHKKYYQSLQKQVVQMDLNNKLVNQFNSVKEASDFTGISHISTVCRGERKQAGGFKWQYKTH